MTERMIEANGVTLCTDAFGDPADAPILLVMGLGGSMLWWDEGLCHLLAGGGRFVIRYDHRDTGRSVTYDPGHPSYNGGDLVADAVGVLDAYGLAAAHIVGVSAGGAFAQFVQRDVERARNVAALQNHDVIADHSRSRKPLSTIRVPTLVIHGSADPMFPVRHGEALAEETPGATLLLLDGAGHGVDEADWETVVAAVLEHTRSVQSD